MGTVWKQERLKEKVGVPSRAAGRGKSDLQILKDCCKGRGLDSKRREDENFWP